MFRLLKREPKWDKINGSSRAGTLFASPRHVMSAFPDPTVLHAKRSETMDGKVDREWWFSDGNGSYFGIYAFKATSQYDPEYPEPVDFWAEDEISRLSISGKGRPPQEFLDFLESTIHGASAQTGYGLA